MAALDVAHGGGFAGGDQTKLVNVVQRPEVVEPLWKFGRGDFEYSYTRPSSQSLASKPMLALESLPLGLDDFLVAITTDCVYGIA